MDTGNKYNRIVGKVKELAEEFTAKLKDKADEKTCTMFKQCFLSTATTTLTVLDDDSVYLITGDIKAMWLRDSSAQVVHYLPFAKLVRVGKFTLCALYNGSLRTDLKVGATKNNRGKTWTI